MIEANAALAGAGGAITDQPDISGPFAQAHQRIRRYEMSDALRSYLRSKYLNSGATPDSVAPGSAVSVASAPRRRPVGGRPAVRRDGSRALLAHARVGSLGPTLILCAGLALVRPAHGGELVLDGSGVLIGADSAKYTFSVQDGGTLNLSFEDLAWPSPLESLRLEITSATQTLLTMSGPGQQSLSLPGAGTYYAYVIGNGAGNLDIGAYRLLGTQVAPVPLPSSLMLLLGGAASLWWLRRKPIYSAAPDAAGAPSRVNLPALT